MNFLSHLQVWPYGLVMSFAFIAMIVVSLMTTRFIRKVRKARIFCALAWSMPFALLSARLTWCLVNFSDYILGNPLSIFKVWEGGLSLWGGILAALIVIGIYGRMVHVHPGAILDAVTPGLLVFIAIMRFAEPLANQGYGREIAASWANLPFLSAVDACGVARFAVWRMEGAAAIFLAFCALTTRVSKQQPGEIFRPSFAAMAALQQVFESMREDDYLCIGTVRMSQLFAAVAVLGVLIYYVIICAHCESFTSTFVSILLFIAGGALVVLPEFAMSGVANPAIQYLVMTAGAVVMLLSIFPARRIAIRELGELEKRFGRRWVG